MNPFATHMPLLLACLRRTSGPVLELGSGWFSTPLIAALATDRLVRTVETIDMKWMNHRGPWTTFVPSSLTTAALGMIIRDGMMKGWYQGMRLSAGDRS